MARALTAEILDVLARACSGVPSSSTSTGRPRPTWSAAASMKYPTDGHAADRFPSAGRSPIPSSISSTGSAARARRRARRALIGGAGVARGYLNRPELTAERSCPTRSARARRSSVQDRRPGALARRRQHRVPRPHRPPGQDPGLPHRAGRDRSGAGAAPGSAEAAVVLAREDTRATSVWSPTSLAISQATTACPGAELRTYL